jgi:hypothetical protein
MSLLVAVLLSTNASGRLGIEMPSASLVLLLPLAFDALRDFSVDLTR